MTTSGDNDRKAFESGISVLDSISVVIPVELYYVCDMIAKALGGNEFSILSNIEKEENGKVYISKDYYIPPQEVAAASIEYMPDEEASKYNVVFHRHPDSCNSFSGTDKDYINQNFKVSILYTKNGGFVNGIYNLPYQQHIIPMPIKSMIAYGIEVPDISPIREKGATVYTRGNSTGRSWNSKKNEWERYDSVQKKWRVCNYDGEFKDEKRKKGKKPTQGCRWSHAEGCWEWFDEKTRMWMNENDLEDEDDEEKKEKEETVKETSIESGEQTPPILEGKDSSQNQKEEESDSTSEKSTEKALGSTMITSLEKIAGPATSNTFELGFEKTPAAISTSNNKGAFSSTDLGVGEEEESPCYGI